MKLDKQSNEKYLSIHCAGVGWVIMEISKGSWYTREQDTRTIFLLLLFSELNQVYGVFLDDFVKTRNIF